MILFMLGVLISCAAGPLQAEWHSAIADSRYRIERSADSPGASDTGYFLLWPNDRAISNTCLEVFSTNGTPMGHRVLWSAEGEPLKVLFDASSHETAYYVYTGPIPGNPPEWTPKSGLILETRKRAEGKPTNAAAIWTICDDSGPVLGRSLLPNIFLGVHPHGPTADFVSIINGFFSVQKAGEYDFATVSEDASCLLVDGKIIAQWPDWHDWNGGRRGQHHGKTTLAAGSHRIEYLNVKRGPGYTVEAAWRPPGRDEFDIIPASAFAPVAMFAVTSYEPAPASPTGARFTWQITAHFTIEVATLVHVKFKALSTGQHYTWDFDDGIRAQTPAVEHIFLSPGMRTVTLEVQNPEGKATVSQRVLVHPLWTQEKDQPRHLFREERQRLAREDLHAAPVADLVSIYRIAADEEDLPMARRFALLCLQRKADFGADGSGVFREMAMFLQRPDLQEYALAEQAFRIVMESPLFLPGQKAWATLHLAGLLIHYVGRVEEAQDLLARVELVELSDSDKRLQRIYTADAFFAQGHLELARKVYVNVGTSYARGDTGHALRRQARLETARDYLRRGEFDAAEQMVRYIEWEAPEQRMGTETGFIMIRVCIGRKEFQRALLLSRKLLPVAETDIRKSELLSAIVEICLALKRDSEAANAYRQLLTDHPYSEAAARAKEIWGGRIAGDKK